VTLLLIEVVPTPCPSGYAECTREMLAAVYLVHYKVSRAGGKRRGRVKMSLDKPDSVSSIRLSKRREAAGRKAGPTAEKE
jgi:hypothetical protein